ncbi:MAG: glycosyltransferase [Lachnospiraceae bacterium]|nr:glycosyltransferase [Lachnospiraceae bacterium]
MGNMVIVTHWLDGDVIPFVRIGKELKQRGHDVTLITHCHFEKVAREAGLDFRAWDTPEEYALLVEEMKGNKTDNSKENSYSFENSEFKQRYESNETRLKEFNIIAECCKRKDTVLLCKNRSSIAAYLVAEKFKLPLATVMMNPAEIESMLLYEQLEGKNDLPRLNELRSAVNLSSVGSWLQWESSAKKTFALWPNWYDTASEEWPSKIEAVGFPLEKGKEETKKEVPEKFKVWLKKNPNPVVITGGTTKCINDKFYSSSISACGMSGKPTVVLTRYKEFLPKKLPDNVVWYDYLPLDMIMPKLGLIIHHGGMGTLSGALSAGIPQLILPCYVDRPHNANLINKLGVGDFLYPVNWQPDKILSMMNNLQDDQIKNNCMKYVLKMKNNVGITNIADRVEEMAKDKKYIYSINSQYKIPVKLSGEHTSNNSQPKIKDLNQRLSNEQRARLLVNLRRREESRR